MKWFKRKPKPKRVYISWVEDGREVRCYDPDVSVMLHASQHYGRIVVPLNQPLR